MTTPGPNNDILVSVLESVGGAVNNLAEGSHRGAVAIERLNKRERLKNIFLGITALSLAALVGLSIWSLTLATRRSEVASTQRNVLEVGMVCVIELERQIPTDTTIPQSCRDFLNTR